MQCLSASVTVFHLPDHSLPDSAVGVSRDVLQYVTLWFRQNVERDVAVVILQRRGVVIPEGQLRLCVYLQQKHQSNRTTLV